MIGSKASIMYTQMQNERLLYSNTLGVCLETLNCCFGHQEKNEGKISPKLSSPITRCLLPGVSHFPLGTDLVKSGLYKMDPLIVIQSKRNNSKKMHEERLSKYKRENGNCLNYLFSSFLCYSNR